MEVTLTTGYQVALAEPQGINHLFQAILGESLDKVSGSEIWSELYAACVTEVFYVAGQLKQAGSEMDLVFLLEELPKQWGRIAKRINDE